MLYSDAYGTILIVVPIGGEILGCPFSVFVEIRILDSDKEPTNDILSRHRVEKACCGYLIRDPLPLRNRPKPPSVPVQTLWMYAADSESDFLRIDAEMAMNTIRDLFPRKDGCFTLRYPATNPTTGYVATHKEFWRKENVEGEQEGWWLRAMGTHSDKGSVYAGCIIRVADFAQGFLKSETGIGVVRWSNRVPWDGIVVETKPGATSWHMTMAAGDVEEIEALNFWIKGEWEDDMVDGQRWSMTVRGMEVEWRCAKLLDW